MKSGAGGGQRTRAFSDEVDAGSAQENATKQNLEPRSDSIGSEQALAVQDPLPASPLQGEEMPHHPHSCPRFCSCMYVMSGVK
jgi:hypothetical protein